MTADINGSIGVRHIIVHTMAPTGFCSKKHHPYGNGSTNTKQVALTDLSKLASQHHDEALLTTKYHAGATRQFICKYEGNVNVSNLGVVINTALAR